MKMKKLLAVSAAVAMSATLFVGCGSSDSTAASDATSVAAAAETTAAEAATSAAAESSTTEASTTETASTEALAAPEADLSGTTLTVLVDADTAAEGYEAVFAAATEKYGVKFDIETRVGGSDGDNLVKTRLASGDIPDLTLYNCGAKLFALNPTEYFYDFSNDPIANTFDDTFKSTVTYDGKVMGVPVYTTQAGAVMYYKPDYEELGLSVPTTWDEFLSNCKALKDAGKTAIAGSFGTSWTSQVIYLGDEYNVLAENPTFPADFEAGTAKYATTAAGLESFQKLADVIPYYNEDYTATTYDDAVDMLANGEATHWISLTQALGNMQSLYPDAMDDIGVFAIPGNDPDNCGLTVWYPSCWYVNKDSANVDAAVTFMEYWCSKEGLDIYNANSSAYGPTCIKGYSLPDNVLKCVKEDMQSYFDAGKTAPALEFETSVKGANCEQFTSAVGTGQMTAEEAASQYDEDCKKQAVQLGLNWK